MKLHRTWNKELIKSVVSQMWDHVCEDGHSLDAFDPKPNENCWVSIEDIGMYNLHPHNSTTLEIHAFILPTKRKEHSKLTGQEILKWILDNAPKQYQKIIAQVPSIYPNVKDFCIKNGFQVEGVNRLSHKKNGEIVDQWLLGITREEIKEAMLCHS